MHKIKANIFLEARREWHSATAGQRGEAAAEGGEGSVLPAAAAVAAAADRLAALAENENCA